MVDFVGPQFQKKSYTFKKYILAHKNHRERFERYLTVWEHLLFLQSTDMTAPKHLLLCSIWSGAIL